MSTISPYPQLTDPSSPRAINTICTDYEKTIALTGPLLEDLFSSHRPVSAPSTDFRSSNQGSSHQGRPTRLERTLEMNYHYIHLSICRAILRPFLQPTVENLNEADYILAHEQARIRAETCISAAVEFIHGLRPDASRLYGRPGVRLHSRLFVSKSCTWLPAPLIEARQTNGSLASTKCAGICV